MADSTWFRFGSRPRTPIPPPSPTPPEQPSTGEADELSRQPTVPRIPSRLSLHNRVSPTELSTPTSNTDLLVKEQDKIWHNPSLDQMLQALQVAIMTNGIMESIPVPYNTYVLHLIESFSDHRERLTAADAACEEINKARSQTLEDFRIVADEWSRRETQYRAEIKRLEVLLARNSHQGLETVALARADSIVERDQPDARKFVSRLRELRDQMATREASSEPSVADLESSLFLGQSIMTDTQIMRAMEPSQPVQEQRGVNQVQSQKPPLPNILDREMDLRLSQRIRRADADAAAASSRAWGQRKMHRLSARASHPLYSPLSSSSESEGGRFDATAAGPVKGAKGTTGVAEPAAPLAPSARRPRGVEAGTRGDVGDGDEAGADRRVAGVASTPQATVHPKNPNPHPNKAREERFSFVPGDDGFLAQNRQVDGQSTPRAHEKASRFHHEGKSATGLAHAPSPAASRPPHDGDLTARRQGLRTAATAARPARGAESSGRHGHGPTGGATPGLKHQSGRNGTGHEHEPCMMQTMRGTQRHQEQTRSLSNAQMAASRTVASMRERNGHKNAS